LFHLSCLSAYVSYFVVRLVGPGFVPKRFEGDHHSSLEEMCQVCEGVKPPRAHHCSHCNRCVLKMDHHCYYTGTCIGSFNYKYYFMLLFFGAAGSFNVLLINFFSFFDTLFYDYFLEKDWLLIIHFLVSAFLFVMCVYLLYFHIGLVLADLTTIESYRQDLGEKKINKSLWENMKEGVGGFISWPIFKRRRTPP